MCAQAALAGDQRRTSSGVPSAATIELVTELESITLHRRMEGVDGARTSLG
jgi:hypothetical protein